MTSALQGVQQHPRLLSTHEMPENPQAGTSNSLLAVPHIYSLGHRVTAGGELPPNGVKECS